LTRKNERVERLEVMTRRFFTSVLRALELPASLQLQRIERLADRNCLSKDRCRSNWRMVERNTASLKLSCFCQTTLDPLSRSSICILKGAVEIDGEHPKNIRDV